MCKQPAFRFSVHRMATELCRTFVCFLFCRLLQEEASKRTELEQIHLQQQEVLSQSQKEKEELEKEKIEKERALQVALEQLESLKLKRQGAQEEYKVADFLDNFIMFTLSN